jgi:hypothetical protein
MKKLKVGDRVRWGQHTVGEIKSVTGNEAVVAISVLGLPGETRERILPLSELKRTR